MLELKNVTKKYQSKTIFASVSWQLEKGEILAIVGPSGGGKTTLLRVISGLTNLDGGEIFLDGEKLAPASKQKRMQAPVGIVFQEFNLFPHLTVIENITLAPIQVLKQSKQEAVDEAERLLNLLELTEQKEQLPYQLSGGQKQRVAIARALAMKPKVLCYDEPTSALDPNLRANVAAQIASLKSQGIMQIVVTHDHDFARGCADRIIDVSDLKKGGNEQ